MSDLLDRIKEMKAKREEAIKLAKSANVEPPHPPRNTPWVETGDRASRGMLEVAKSVHGMANPDEVGKAFQDAADDMVLAFRIAKHDPRWEGNTQGLREFLAGSDLGQMYQDAYVEVAKAMDEGTATEGGNWVPETYSNRLAETYRLPTVVADLFEKIPCKSDTHHEPVDGPDLDARRGAESDSDDVYANANLITAITPTTYRTTFTATNVEARVDISSQLEQDAVIRMVNKVRSKLQVAHGLAKDRAVINGYLVATAAVYPDADVEADPTVATRSERLWDGIRALVNAGARIDCGGVDVTLTRLLQAKAAMGVYGVRPADLVLIAGVIGDAKLQGIPELVTLDKYGPQATVLTGEVGKVSGMTTVISECVKEDVSATGFNTGGGPNTFIDMFIVNRKAWAIGVREPLTIITHPLPLSRQVAVASFERLDFEEMVYDVTAVNGCAELYNMPQ